MTQFVKWLKLPQGEEEESSEGMTFHPPTPQGSQQTARTALPLHHFIEVAKEVTAIPRAPALYIEATQGPVAVGRCWKRLRFWSLRPPGGADEISFENTVSSL